MACMQDKARVVGHMSGYAGAPTECKVIHRGHPITLPSSCAAGQD